MVLGRLDLGVPLPSTIQVTLPVVLLPLLVGTVVTVLASLVPAREATRVSPIAALRPADAPAVGARGGRVRLAFSLLLTLGGVGVMLLAAVLSSSGRGDQTLLLGVGALAGGLSFVGVLLGAVFWVPKVVSARRTRAGEHRDQRAARRGEHRAQPAPDGRDQRSPADRRDAGRDDEHRGRERPGVPRAGARRALPGGPHGRRRGARRDAQPCRPTSPTPSPRSRASPRCSRCGGASVSLGGDRDHGRRTCRRLRGVRAARPTHRGRPGRRDAAAAEADRPSGATDGTVPVHAAASLADGGGPVAGGSVVDAPGRYRATWAGSTASSRPATLEQLASGRPGLDALGRAGPGCRRGARAPGRPLGAARHTGGGEQRGRRACHERAGDRHAPRDRRRTARGRRGDRADRRGQHAVALGPRTASGVRDAAGDRAVPPAAARDARGRGDAHRRRRGRARGRARAPVRLGGCGDHASGRSATSSSSSRGRDLALLLVVALAAGLLASVLPGRAAARTSPVAALAVD